MWRAFALLVSAFRRCYCTGPRITVAPYTDSGRNRCEEAEQASHLWPRCVPAKTFLATHNRTHSARCPVRWAHHAQIAARGLAKMCHQQFHCFVSSEYTTPSRRAPHPRPDAPPECTLVHTFRKPIPQLGLLHLPAIPPMPSSAQDRSTHQG